MRSLTLNEILADLERFPNTRFLAVHYDALESLYVALRASSRVVTQLAQQPVVNAFRRVLLDPCARPCPIDVTQRHPRGVG